ncbi:homeobox-leucine zipper protein HDG5, partial [Tanacetum coccineum]
AQQDRSDNAILRNDNDNLRNENSRLQNALRSLVCTNCGGSSMSFDEQQLRMENARLKEEFVIKIEINVFAQLDRVCAIANQFCGNNPMQAHGQGHNFAAANGLIIMDEEKPIAADYALSFMNEVVKMCRIGEPLWIPVNDAGKEVLNFEEHAKMFPSVLTQKNDLNGLSFEASRASTVVIINSITLVDAFLDADKWMELFPSIISRAKTLQVIVPGVNGTADASLQLMYAELQMLSPLVPTREIHFLRYCARNANNGSWAIIDFPLDSFHETYQPSLTRYKRRPSGCIIQDMPNGYSRHAEAEKELVHGIFTDFVSSGTAFGARRWLAVLQRQCERLASLMARNISDIGAIPSPEARTNLMNLAQRMVRMFCLHITGSSGQSWTALSDSVEDTVRITTRKVTGPGQPNGLIITAVSDNMASSSSTSQVFDLLRMNGRRSPVYEFLHHRSSLEREHCKRWLTCKRLHPGNMYLLLRVNVASNSSQNVELVLQESCTDDSGSLVGLLN